jgi:hypothetical protein
MGISYLSQNALADGVWLSLHVHLQQPSWLTSASQSQGVIYNPFLEHLHRGVRLLPTHTDTPALVASTNNKIRALHHLSLAQPSARPLPSLACALVAVPTAAQCQMGYFDMHPERRRLPVRGGRDDIFDELKHC